MESKNKNNDYKIPDIIISSLFANDKMKRASKELENMVNTYISGRDDIDKLKLLLEKYKSDLFDLNPEFKNNIIRGDITPILAMCELIQKFDPDPKLYFILFKPLFDLYEKELEPKSIKNITNKITEFLTNKTKLVLSNFNDLFEVLILVKINQDQEVKASGNSLDKLLKESLQEYSDNMDLYKDYFDFNSFCSKINEKINLQQYIIITLLVNWMGTICRIRQTRVVKFFHDILRMIFKLQMDKSRDVSKNADNYFKTVKINIEEKFLRYYKYDKESMEKILEIVIIEAAPKSNKINIPAWDIIKLFLIKSKQYMEIYLSKRDNKDPIMNKNTISEGLDSPTKKDNIKDNINIKNTSTFNEVKAKSTMSLPQKEKNQKFSNNDKNYFLPSSNSVYNSDIKNFNKRTSKINMNKGGPGGPSFEFKNKQAFIGELSSDAQFSKDDNILEYIPFRLFPKILILIIETYSRDIDNTELIDKINEILIEIIEKSPQEINNYGFVHQEITSILLIGIKNPTNKNKQHLLDWCNTLYNKYEKNIFNDFNIFIKEFIQATPASNHNFFMGMVRFLSNIKMEGDITNIIMQNLIEKLMEEPSLINNESYVILILENLSQKASLATVYESIVDVLGDIKNYSFVSKMINYLNQYLMRYPKAVNFRKSLINNDDKEQHTLFVKMYKIWAINPISLIIYCVITEHFELAYNIILNLVKVQLDNDYYIHLGTLVQLLESELYDYIRIRLLEPSNNIYLIRALYGILMLLPQGQAFNVLSNRMNNVQTLFVIENGFDNIKEEDDEEEINKFIDIFLNVQKMKREEEDKKK